MAEVPYNRQISTDDTNTPNTLFLPTSEACDAFGIARNNSQKLSKTEEDSIGFLQGTQFRTNIFANDAKASESSNIDLTDGAGADPQNKKLTKNIIDEVCLEFIGNAPTKVNQRQENGIVKTEIDQKPKKEPYLIINVAPSDTDWMSFSHDHEWESGGGVLQQILTGLNEFVQLGSDLMTSFTNIKNNINGSNDFAAGRISKPEFTSTYKASSPTEFTIPFVLFTPGGEIQDFIRDIYYPIMMFNYLSYPKRLNISKEQFDADRKSNLKGAQGSNSQVKSGGDNAGDSTIPTDAVGLQNTINSVYPGFRYAILEPPSYVRVTHSSGLFRFPTCAITNFSYTYKGPWVNMNKDVVKMPEYSAFTKDSTFMQRGFPCIAECKMTFRSVDPLYADDWADMFNKSDVVNISNENSSEGAIKTYRENQIQQDQAFNEAIQNNRFGAGVRFASSVGVNIGFRGNL